jgi:hypothetical protein
MFEGLLTAIPFGAVAGGLVAWALIGTVRKRTYSLEVDVADLQDRHLRQVRKAAAEKRWESEETIEDKIAALAVEPSPKKAGWKKWASKSENSLGESQLG